MSGMGSPGVRGLPMPFIPNAPGALRTPRRRWLPRTGEGLLEETEIEEVHVAVVVGVKIAA